jgi:TRAP-type C4-dicarboxylate transport system permease small subunit
MSQTPEHEVEEATLPFTELTVEEIIAAATLVIIVASVSWGVITRYILETPAAWTSEAASIAFAWTVFIAAAAAFSRGDHSSVDALILKFPPPIRTIVQAVADLIVLATLLTVSWLSIRFAIATADVPTTVLRVPQSIAYSAAALGFVLMAIRHGIYAFSRHRTNGAAS